ncbi:hypothetical protein [Streptomyces rubradiris]|uniref:Uncharacterized protein n=1 Tax=Streptomyces rubradiris TaxID=285531 RepID=A0ABQ3RA94_STRRR|nr:hypothetical protein [Streptomyces rubradiris]GHH25922.1 hypothetical protein GCM10018792_65690 [Streptomyces rubradiris]GHI52774.1 hypothetical protein Srubr_26200 [Streptomyces rubradiris]
MPELTDATAASGAGAPGLERKFAGHAGAAADCRYPDCTEERETPAKGRPGPPPEFCPTHNNRRDKQYAYRQEKKTKAEAAARRMAEETGGSGPTPDPLPVVLARRAREQSVLADLLPRVAAALNTIIAGEQAAADTDAVAAHVAAVDQAAAIRVEEAETARAVAEKAAAAARTAAEASARAAAEANLERDAAVRDAATALGEAAEADQRADTATGALRQLTQDYLALTEQAGRLEGELTVLRPRLDEQAGRIMVLEGELRTANADLATARERADGLQRHLVDLDRDRNAERARHSQALAELLQQLTQLTPQDATLSVLSASPPAAAEAEETGQPAEPDVPEGQMDMFPLGPAGQPLTGPSDPSGAAAEPSPLEPSPRPDRATAGSEELNGADELPVAIEDLGLQAGSGWCMVSYLSSGDAWTVLRDGQRAGTVTPERAITGRRSILGWSAREQTMSARERTMRPTKGRYFSNRDIAAKAVIKASLRQQPEPTTAVPAWWAALTEQTATAVARAAAPLATASAGRSEHLALFTPALRHAALRLAVRAPHEGDLAQLQTISESVLSRSKEGTRLVAALRAAAVASETTALGTLDGRVWTLEPDLEHPNVLIVCADGQPVGTLAPTSANPGGRCTATHRRRTLRPATGRTFLDRDAAFHAVIAAERDHRPLPALDHPAWHRIQPGFRGTLFSAARTAKDLKNFHSQLEPIEYRRAITNALVEARRNINTPVEPEHLAVLLDAPREDLGPKQSARADRLYEVLQRIRDDLLTQSVRGEADPA